MIKRNLLKESQIDIPFAVGGQLRSQREGDLESCLDFVQVISPQIDGLKMITHFKFIFFKPAIKESR